MATQDTQTGLYVGRPQSRVDGPAKVTGQAKYAAEFATVDLTHGVVVSGTIARGRIRRIDTSEALKVPGVLQVFTHENRRRTAWLDYNYRDEVAPPGSPFRPLYDEVIHYSGQPVALVVANDFQTAGYAASLVKVEYEAEEHTTDLELERENAYEPPKKRSGISGPPKPRGGASEAFQTGAVRIEAEYHHPVEHHNPMEPHASTVVFDNGKLTVHDKPQGPINSQSYICAVFVLSKSDVQVVSPFVGGAFGSGLRPQYQLFLAVMASLELKRSVRVVLTRDQMFTFVFRPETIQDMSLACDTEGNLKAIRHEATACTSRFEDYQENVVSWSGMLYQCDNVELGYKIAQLDTYTPADMRAPGATIGVFALESAMDELSYAAGVDPVELRLINYTEKDQNAGKPYTSKALRACYTEGAERFGWAKRNPQPRSMRDGHELVGWGMATGVWEAYFQKSSARATLSPSGRVTVAAATIDMGTGTYTVLAQVAAETLGVPIQNVNVELGDSSLPTSPVSGGSWTATSSGAAVQAACKAVREELFSYARRMDNSPLANASIDHVTFANGRIFLAADPSRSVSITEAMRAGEVTRIEKEESVAAPKLWHLGYSSHTHSAIFVEVRVDEELGVIRVTRVVSAVAAGRILNPKTARSQILGGVVFGMGQALHEESVMDHNLGRFMNHNIAEYHIPVNADVHDIDVIFVDEVEEKLSPIGAKGLGEIGIVGTAAAIANAVYHATGKRVRSLPITIDKLLPEPA